jgi:hypothetical protein
MFTYFLYMFLHFEKSIIYLNFLNISINEVSNVVLVKIISVFVNDVLEKVSNGFKFLAAFSYKVHRREIISQKRKKHSNAFFNLMVLFMYT